MKIIKLLIAVFFLGIMFYAAACTYPSAQLFKKGYLIKENIFTRLLPGHTANLVQVGEADNPVSTALSPAGSRTEAGSTTIEYWSMLFVLVLATFIGLGVILRVSRLLHTPLMSLTNAISAIAVVGSIMVTGENNPVGIRILGAVALFASMTNIVSGFLITDRMLKMFRQKRKEGKP